MGSRLGSSRPHEAQTRPSLPWVISASQGVIEIGLPKEKKKSAPPTASHRQPRSALETYGVHLHASPTNRSARPHLLEALQFVHANF
jgi:hypothetical protein